MINTLLKSLEELLAPSQGSDSELHQLLPCGRCHSRLAWMNSRNETLEQNLCAICQSKVGEEKPGPLPLEAIGEVLQDMREECKNLEIFLAESRQDSASPLKRQDSFPPLIRSPSPVSSSLREKITDIPSRLLGRPGSVRRSSVGTDDIKSVLTPSQEPPEFRGYQFAKETDDRLDGSERNRFAWCAQLSVYVSNYCNFPKLQQDCAGWSGRVSCL